MPIAIPSDILDWDTIKNNLTESVGEPSNCTSPAGHCFGSDGGTGIPVDLKVLPGRGGTFEAYQLNEIKTAIIKKYKVERCQYCQKYNIAYEEIV